MATALSTLDEIRRLATVQENWDGDGAAAVNADSVACAATLWALLSPAKVPVPLIGPNPPRARAVELGVAGIRIQPARHGVLPRGQRRER